MTMKPILENNLFQHGWTYGYITIVDAHSANAARACQHSSDGADWRANGDQVDSGEEAYSTSVFGKTSYRFIEGKYIISLVLNMWIPLIVVWTIPYNLLVVDNGSEWLVRIRGKIRYIVIEWNSRHPVAHFLCWFVLVARQLLPRMKPEELQLILNLEDNLKI